ncbi:MAG: class I SAM-dependent methyltransferase [Nostoc sp.]|uniref:class I SAM-dependent methyltransferase n=1 Tax=Nostoc sp. TaxID=1180 RepID=UPI002FF2DE21
MIKLPNLPSKLKAIIESDYANNPYTSGTSVSLPEALVIASVIDAFKLSQTLEIGLASAGSSAAILAAKSYGGCINSHIAIDPYQKTHSEGKGLKVLEKLGYIDRLEWVENLSESYLPEAIKSKKKFDFILIDGGHGLGQSMIDAYLADRALRVGGFIAIDDIYMKSTCNSIKFLTSECGYDVVDCRTTVLNFPRLLKHSFRLGFSYAKMMVSRCSDSLVVLQKVKDYYGGY